MLHGHTLSMKSLLALVLVCSIAFLSTGSSGCKSPNSTDPGGTNSNVNVDKTAATVQLVAQIAVYQVIQGHPEYRQYFAAAATAIKSFALGQDLSPESLENIVANLGGSQDVSLAVATGIAVYKIWFADFGGLDDKSPARVILGSLVNGISAGTKSAPPPTRLAKMPKAKPANNTIITNNVIYPK